MRFLCMLVIAIWPLAGAVVDGVNIHWSSAGRGKKSVVLVHGWTGDSSIWDGQTPALLKEQYRVITLDLPGHGKSGLPKDGKFSMDLFARAIEAVRHEAKAGRIVLVGHSMGTPVVRQYARLYPENTVALVLVDGVILNAENGQRFATISQRFAGPDGRKNHEQFLQQMFTKTPENIQPEIVKVSMATPAATVVGAMAALGDPAIWKEDVIDKPVLGIYAEQSHLADREVTATVFPKFDYNEIPGTDHFLMLENPDEFNRLLLGFLSKLTW